jgi:hypothetical protein
MGNLALSPADCCCCPSGCFADGADPASKHFAVTLAGIVNNDCVFCDAYNATYSPLTYGSLCLWVCERFGVLTCFRDPTVYLRLECADGQMAITVDLYDDNIPYYSWSKSVVADLVTPTYLDGLSLPLVSPDGGDCVAAGSTCTIHLL